MLSQVLVLVLGLTRYFTHTKSSVRSFCFQIIVITTYKQMLVIICFFHTLLFIYLEIHLREFSCQNM